MYTSHIGLKFLDLYNRKSGTQHSAASFFDQVMFPVFFDHRRHLMHVSNSPFFQSVPDKRVQELGMRKSLIQYQNLQHKVREAVAGGQPDASIYVGYAANGPDQTTSGQLSSIKPPIYSDDIYASWIGNALAVRVEGSQCLLLDSEAALWHLFEGWQRYRDYLEPVGGMEGRQIETWNGYWLAQGDPEQNPSPPVKNGKLETVSWIKVLARLARWHPREVLPAYIFTLGQTNKTFGFINLHLPHIQRMREAEAALRERLMARSSEGDDLFWETYESAYSFYIACQMGEIGLRTLKPRDFAKLMEGDFSPSQTFDKHSESFFHIVVWITAMLNNKTDLQELAAKLAAELRSAEEKKPDAKRGKSSVSAEAKGIFEAKTLTKFIEALSEFISSRSIPPSTVETCRQVVSQSIRIPAEQLPLFRALIRFEYIVASQS